MKTLYDHFHNVSIGRIIEMAAAWTFIDKRAGEAHNYCNKYIKNGLGESVWHLVLDDAIRMRKELEDKRQSKEIPV